MALSEGVVADKRGGAGEDMADRAEGLATEPTPVGRRTSGTPDDNALVRFPRVDPEDRRGP